MMTFAIDKPLILEQLKRQLNSLFLNSEHDFDVLDAHYEATLERAERCFAQTPNKYYQKDGQPFFSPYISTQYTIFLYYFANTIYKSAPSESEVCDKLYYLNKSLNSVDIYYAVALPDFFMCEHPVGSVMGRGKYGDGFLFYQCCAVGGFHLSGGKIVYPNIGRNVKMFAGSMILGDCTIADNVNIGAGALLKNQSVPPNCNVFGQSPNIIIKPKTTQ
ncbi:MAG: transferase [Mucinivorans sp.]